MSTWPRPEGRPFHWGLLTLALLAICGIALLVTGSWTLYDGLNGIVVDHNNPYIHFSETTAAQEVTVGWVLLILGAACVTALVVLYFTRKSFLFPIEKAEGSK